MASNSAEYQREYYKRNPDAWKPDKDIPGRDAYKRRWAQQNAARLKMRRQSLGESRDEQKLVERLPLRHPILPDSPFWEQRCGMYGPTERSFPPSTWPHFAAAVRKWGIGFQ